ILPFILPVLILCCFLYGYGTRQSILFVLMLDFWASGNTTLWYFSALFVFVLLAPMVFSLMENGKKGFLVMVFLAAVSFVYYMHCRQMIFASRLPIYFLGFYFGDFSLKKKKITPLCWQLSISSVVAGAFLLYWCYPHYDVLMWGLGFYWYPFVLITPGLCLLLAGFFELLETKLKCKGKLFSWLGTLTMEVYLFHELIVKQVDYFIYYTWDPHGYFRNIMSFLIAFGIAVMYHYVINKIMEIIMKKA
ncbi:MAG: acyltransferase family protein, partial [Erysipelotrichaceae bacterium]|nr:acyltransferase family protein [Erysipelotrichaceae bacterium]